MPPGAAPTEMEVLSMRALEAWTERLARWLALLAAISLVLMMVQTVIDVVMSRVFNSPIEGNIEVISVYHMVLVVFLPLAMVELRHEHINADLFVQMLSEPLQRAVYVFGCLISLGFFGLLCYQTWIDAIESLKINEVLMGSIYVPVWPAKFALPIGFAVMLLVVVLHIVRTLTDAGFKPVPPAPDAPENLPAI
jgi:TRAP-type C4-dicarboxylate transport system permease small subunit